MTNALHTVMTKNVRVNDYVEASGGYARVVFKRRRDADPDEAGYDLTLEDGSVLRQLDGVSLRVASVRTGPRGGVLYRVVHHPSRLVKWVALRG